MKNNKYVTDEIIVNTDEIKVIEGIKGDNSYIELEIDEEVENVFIEAKKEACEKLIADALKVSGKNKLSDFIVNIPVNEKGDFRSPRQMERVFKGESFSRDSLLIILVTIVNIAKGQKDEIKKLYDRKYVDKFLCRFGFEELYPRSKRDFIICKAIEKGINIDELNTLLEEKGCDTFEVRRKRKE